MRRFLFLSLAALALQPFVPAWAALLAGVGFGLVATHPCPIRARQAQGFLLQASVVGLGAAVDLGVVVDVGLPGVVRTFVSIAATLALAWGLAKLLGAERDPALLIGVGTAICGGSAIAAVAPAIAAKSEHTSVALAVVFLLNAVALVVFPPLGHAFGLEPAQFGVWSALAIHDTSSVVGAAMQFGDRALEVATTMKLTRALWIVPVTLVLARLVRGGEAGAKPNFPWFIAAFVAVAAIVTFVPALAETGRIVAAGARRGLVLALFLIGAGVNREALRTVGARPLVLGVGLWVLVAGATLVAVRAGFAGRGGHPQLIDVPTTVDLRGTSGRRSVAEAELPEPPPARMSDCRGRWQTPEPRGSEVNRPVLNPRVLIRPPRARMSAAVPRGYLGARGRVPLLGLAAVLSTGCVAAMGPGLRAPDTQLESTIDLLDAATTDGGAIRVCGLAPGDPVAALATSPCNCAPTAESHWQCSAGNGAYLGIFFDADRQSVNSLVSYSGHRQTLQDACAHFRSAQLRIETRLGAPTASRDRGCRGEAGRRHKAAAMWLRGGSSVVLSIENFVEDADHFKVFLELDSAGQSVGDD